MYDNESKFSSSQYSAEYSKKIKQVSESISKKFDEFQKQVELDLTPIDKSELALETNRNISLLHKYLTRYAEEKMQLLNYEKKMDSIKAELFHFFRFDWDRSTKLTESAIAKYVEGHECYIELNSLIQLQKILNNYIEGVIDTLRNRNFAIKNIIDVKKMELNIN